MLVCNGAHGVLSRSPVTSNAAPLPTFIQTASAFKVLQATTEPSLLIDVCQRLFRSYAINRLEPAMRSITLRKPCRIGCDEGFGLGVVSHPCTSTERASLVMSQTSVPTNCALCGTRPWLCRLRSVASETYIVMPPDTRANRPSVLSGPTISPGTSTGCMVMSGAASLGAAPTIEQNKLHAVTAMRRRRHMTACSELSWPPAKTWLRLPPRPIYV